MLIGPIKHGPPPLRPCHWERGLSTSSVASEARPSTLAVQSAMNLSRTSPKSDAKKRSLRPPTHPSRLLPGTVHAWTAIRPDVRLSSSGSSQSRNLQPLTQGRIIDARAGSIVHRVTGLAKG
ncbi:unnamed protein product [Arctogadus glacialis]